MVTYAREEQEAKTNHIQALDSRPPVLLSQQSFDVDFEKMLLASTLEESSDELGPSDPFVRTALNGHTASQTALGLIEGTKIAEPEFRRSLLEGGAQSVLSSSDSLLSWMRKLEPLIRREKEWYSHHIARMESAARANVARARFIAYGSSAYPDGNSTLRLSYGTVKGYSIDGQTVASVVTLYGLYDRAFSFDLRVPFDIPRRYVDASHAGRVDLTKSLNFVCTCDVTEGNSGSPVVDRNGDVLGLVFDGNVASTAGMFAYDADRSRAIGVSTAGITEVLENIYRADSIVRELEAGAQENN